MGQWMAWLAGDEFDLKALSSLYTEPDCHVAKDDDDAYYLTSISFDPMSEASQVYTASTVLVRRINRLQTVDDSRYQPVYVASITRLNDNGSRTNTRFATGAVALVGSSRFAAHGVVLSPDGMPVPPQQPERAQAQLRLAALNDRVDEALEYFDRCVPGDADCYSYAYKISEIILEDMGAGDITVGVAAAISEGWSTADEMSNFTETVHKREFGGRKARHAGTRATKAGAKRLSEDEVIACIRRVLRGWLDWKVGQGP